MNRCVHIQPIIYTSMYLNDLIRDRGFEMLHSTTKSNVGIVVCAYKILCLIVNKYFQI